MCAPPAPSLSCESFVQLVESSLSREVSSRVYAHKQERASSFLPPLRPLPFIKLYNAVLKHVAECVSSQELTRLSWPPGEFCALDNKKFVLHVGWNRSEHLSWIRDAILSLQLPLWDAPSTSVSWPKLCRSVGYFISKLQMCLSLKHLLMSRLEKLLERCRSSPGAEGWSIPWDEVLEICIDHKLKNWKLPGLPPSEAAMTEDGRILVYYFSDALSSFSAPDEWTEAVRQTQTEKHQQQEDTFRFSCLKEPGHSALSAWYISTPDGPLAHRVKQQSLAETHVRWRMLNKLKRLSKAEALVQPRFPMIMPSATLLSTPTLVLPPTGHARAAHVRATAQV